MNRYKSRQRWVKREPGVWMSPCGRFQASSEGYARWMLVEVQSQRTAGPFVTLADCQEHAARVKESA